MISGEFGFGFKMDDGLQKILSACNPKVVEQAYYRAIKRISGPVLQSSRSDALKAAEARYHISKNNIYRGGKIRKVTPRLSRGVGGTFAAHIVIGGSALNLKYFPQRERTVKTFVGPPRKDGKRKKKSPRKQVRVQIMRGGPHRAQRLENNIPKRWPHKYPEFGGFRIGSKGKLVFTRTRAPIGGPGAREHDRRRGVVSMRTMNAPAAMLNKHTIKDVWYSVERRLPQQVVDGIGYYMQRYQHARSPFRGR